MIDLRCGDCLEILPTLADGSVDAIVTDPPYGLKFMAKEWDHGVPGVPFWSAMLRVLKPGGYLLAFGGTRTFHRQVCAIEDAGFEIRDCIQWLYGQGFPKAKSCLKPGWEPITLALRPSRAVPPLNIDECRIGITDLGSDGRRVPGNGNVGSGGIYNRGWTGSDDGAEFPHQGSSRHDARGRWPANLCFSHHPDCTPIGMKRVRPTAHYTVGHTVTRESTEGWRYQDHRAHSFNDADGLETVEAWKCVDGCPVAELDAQSGTLTTNPGTARTRHKAGMFGPETQPGRVLSRGDSGGASRFFYCSKASRSDRGEGNTHPTVKPSDLMCWLLRLITKPGDLVLDPFMGSGSTGVACIRAGRHFIGIEADPGYFAIARSRIDAEIARTPLLA